jgi:hypothetical protein
VCLQEFESEEVERHIELIEVADELPPRVSSSSGKATLMLGLLLSPLLILGLNRAGKLEPDFRDDLWRRCRSWLFLVPMIVLPILLGALWAIVSVCLLSVLCFGEFERTTGFFREKLMNLLVVLGIFGLSFACLDHWYRLFVALTPMVIVVIAAGTAVPVIPCAITGAARVWPADSRWPRARKVHLKIGPPLSFEALSNNRAGWEQVSREAEDAVRRLIN